MQNTYSHTELDTVPPPPAWKCPLGKFRSGIMHGAYQMHRFRRHTTSTGKLDRFLVEPGHLEEKKADTFRTCLWGLCDYCP